MSVTEPTAPPQGRCANCDEVVLTDYEGRCLWCDGPTTPVVAPKPKRPLRPDDGRRRWRCRIPAEAVRAAHVVYVRQGLSCRQIAALIWERYGYKSQAACAESLFRAFKKLGLALRSQREVTIARNLKHGRKRRNITAEEDVAYRRWLAEQRGWNAVHGPGQERCEAVKQQAPGKGKRCSRPAMEGSEFCVSHDPARRLAHQAHLAQMRRRLPKRELVPIGPFSQWLAGRSDELGSQRALARALDCSPSTVGDLIGRRDGQGRPKHEIGADTVRRYLDAEGTTTFEDLYGATEAIAA